MEDKLEPESVLASAPESSPVAPVWPPPIEGSMYNQDVTPMRKPRTFSFTTGMVLPFVLVFVLGFMTHGVAPPQFSAINPAIVFLIEFLALNAVVFAGTFGLRKVFQTNIREFGIGMLVSFAMIGLSCLYISR